MATVVRAGDADLAIPTRVVCECAALRNAVEAGQMCELPASVTPQCMMRVVKYYVDCYLPEHADHDGAITFFGRLPLPHLRELMEAAHTLGADGLLDHVVGYVARTLGSGPPEAILSVLGMNADTTAEERRRRREEMDWALAP